MQERLSSKVLQNAKGSNLKRQQSGRKLKPKRKSIKARITKEDSRYFQVFFTKGKRYQNKKKDTTLPKF